MKRISRFLCCDRKMSFYSAASYSPSFTHHHHGPSYTHYYASHMPSVRSATGAVSTPAPPASTGWWRKATPTCTPEELTAIIVAPSGGYYEIPSDPYNEVYPGIIIGDGTTALCVMKLKSMGVTHVLNAACGKDTSFGLINTSPSFYSAAGIKFLGIEAYDMQCFDISPFFYEAADFIETAIASRGKCYVHCKMGVLPLFLCLCACECVSHLLLTAINSSSDECMSLVLLLF